MKKKIKMSVPEKVGLIMFVVMIATLIMCCATTFKATEVEFESNFVREVK